MIALVTAIVAAAYRRRGLVAAALLVVMAMSAVGARRLSFDADVLSLLPHDGRVISAFRTYLGRFGSVDQLYVVFTAPDGHAVSEYADEIDEWADGLRRAPEVAQVDTGVADSGRDSSMRTVSPILASLASSWALNLVVKRMTRL